MIILSIDIGIKNLAFCILDSNSNEIIQEWNIINLCSFTPTCCKCNKPAKFYREKIFYCKFHSKYTEYKIPDKNTKNLSKKNITMLRELCNTYEIDYNKSSKKNELIKYLDDYFNKDYLNIIEPINANNIKLIDLGISIKNEFNKIFSEFYIHSIDMILIENQISPIANRMKSIQGMVAQYFIDKGNYNIEFISAINKLKLFKETKKTTYNERKQLSINYTREFLLKKELDNRVIFFNKHTKKDDLADSLLQGLYYLSVNDNFNL